MRRVAFIVAALIATGAACGSSGESQRQSALTDSTKVAGNGDLDPASMSAPQTVVPETSSSKTSTTPGASATTEQTIYRPVPIREGDRVVAPIQPVEGVSLDNSSVTLRVVELSDGRFLEADLESAVVPEAAAFWTTEINGGLRSRTTARQGSTLGIRVDTDVLGDSFLVTFSATTADGEVLATTGEIEMAG